jgi:hypothetical protein
LLYELFAQTHICYKQKNKAVHPRRNLICGWFRLMNEFVSKKCKFFQNPTNQCTPSKNMRTVLLGAAERLINRFQLKINEIK